MKNPMSRLIVDAYGFLAARAMGVGNGLDLTPTAGGNAVAVAVLGRSATDTTTHGTTRAGDVPAAATGLMR